MSTKVVQDHNMGIVEILLTGTLFITWLWLLVIVFQKEGALLGIACFIIFPITYVLAAFNIKIYGMPILLQTVSLAGFWALGYEL